MTTEEQEQVKANTLEAVCLNMVALEAFETARAADGTHDNAAVIASAERDVARLLRIPHEEARTAVVIGIAAGAIIRARAS